MLNNLFLIISSVLLNASAQLFIKKGMHSLGVISITPGNILLLIVKSCTNMPIILGMSSYVISILLWMVVLSRVNVSLAYPFLSIGYIFTAILAYFLFNEPLTLQKVFGIFTICCGVILLTYSKG